MPSLPLIDRLTKRPQFLAAAKGRVQAKGAVMIQMIAGPAEADLRVGFTATKKLGNAVVRNRCKRRMREAARALLPLHGVPGHDYVFVARQSLAARPWERLLDDVKSALVSLAAPDTGSSPRRSGERSAPTSSPGAEPRLPPKSLAPKPR